MIHKLTLALMMVCLPALPAATLNVNLSGTTNPAFANKLSDSDVQVARFVLQAGGGDVAVDGITIHFTNPALADNAFSAVRLFYDADGNGSFDPSEEVGTAQVPDGINDSITFTGSFLALSGFFRELQLRVDVANDTAAYGEAFQFRIDNAASIILPPASADVIAGSLPATGNPITIRNSMNQLVPGSGNPASPRGFERGSANVGALHFLIDGLTAIAPGELVGLQLQSLTLSITLQSAAQGTVPTGLALWQDDGDALFEPNGGEVQILKRTPADLGKWVLAGNVITVTFDGLPISLLPPILTGQARAFWVSIDFAAGADCTCEVSINRTGVLGAAGAAGDFVVTNPASVGGDVIQVAVQPKPAKAPEAEGEGGCSTSESPTAWYLLLIVPVGFLAWRRHGARNRAILQDT